MKRNSSAERINNINRLKVQSLLALRDENVSDLARGVGVSPQYMHDMLRGNRSIEPYEQLIADYLQVPLQRIRARRPTRAVTISAITSHLTPSPESAPL